MRRVAGIVLPVALVGGLVSLVVLWLLFQHKPVWYRPATLDEAGIRRARADATAKADSVSDRMVQGRPFEVVLTDRHVNEWLAALPHSWPDASRSIPPELSDLAVRFEDGHLRVGAHVERSGWHVILSAGLAIRMDDDGAFIELALIDVRGGSLAVPKAILERLLAPLRRRVRTGRGADSDVADSLASALEDLDSADELFGGVKIRNRFIWRNGDRPFRIDSLTIDRGELRLRLVPL